MSYSLKSRKSSFLICGLVRDCEATIQQDLERLREAFSAHGEISFMLVESDSSDNTLEVISHLQEQTGDIEVISLGNLSNELPNRIERLAFCRNTYLTQVLQKRTDGYMVVADLDNLNTQLDSGSLDCEVFDFDFSAIFANQKGPYYDLLALRHQLWCPNDIFAERTSLINFGLSEREAGMVSVVSRMIRIPETSPPIPVRSAFGGLAIYRIDQIPQDARYSALDFLGKPVCEHVPFNEAIADAGGKLFILPSLINAKLTEHTSRVGGIRMFVRWAIWPFRTLLGIRAKISII